MNDESFPVIHPEGVLQLLLHGVHVRILDLIIRMKRLINHNMRMISSRDGLL